MHLAKNYLIILLCIAVGVVFGLHHILIAALQDNYEPLVVYGVTPLTHDETLYASRIRDVYDGNIFSRDAQTFEKKYAPNPYSMFPFIVLGGFTFMTGSVQNTMIISDFLFPSIIFILVYFLMMLLTENKYVSSACGVFVMFSEDILRAFPFVGIGQISYISSRLDNNITSPLTWLERLPYLEFVFVFFILSLIFLYLAIERGGKKYIIMSGITAGLLFYNYLYYWTFFLAGACFLFAIFLLKKDPTDVKKLATIVAIMLVVSLPFWLEYLNFNSQVYSKDFNDRIGIEYGRDVKIVTSLKLFSALGLFVFFTRVRNKAFYMFVALLLGGIAAVNIQVLTGFTVQSPHWMIAANNQVVAMMLFYSFYQIIRCPERYKELRAFPNFIKSNYKKICIVIIILFIAYGIRYKIVYSENTYKYFTLPSDMLQAYDWLDRNTSKDDVVLSASVENVDLIPVYTHDNNLLANVFFSSISEDELLDRLYTGYKILNVSPEFVGDMLDQEGDPAEAYFSGISASSAPSREVFEKSMWMLSLVFDAKYTYPEVKPVPEDVKNEIIGSYRNYTENLYTLLSNYRLDYIYIGPYEKQISSRDFSAYPQFKEVWSNGNITIYKVDKDAETRL